MGELIDLSREPYEFEVLEAGAIPDRFTLHSSIENVLGVTSDKITIYSIDKQIHIHRSESEVRTYRVYNMMGSLVMQATVAQEAHLNASHLTEGIYIITDGSEAQKLLIK